MTIEERVLFILDKVNKDISTYKGGDLFQEQIISSFEILDIVMEIEEEFSVEIDPHQLIPENFKNIESIIRMVKYHIGK